MVMSAQAYQALVKKQEKKPKWVKKPIDWRNIKKSATLSANRIDFSWAGADISLNEWYAGKHWTKRNKARNQWHDMFRSMLTGTDLPKFDRYLATMTYNSAIDPSNCITMVKFFEDVMEDLGIIKNDNKKHCRGGIHLIPDLSMKHRHYEITIIAYDPEKAKAV